MTDVNATSSVYELPGISRPREPENNSSLGQADFLRLMTTQLRNQDPFEPLENGEFLGQIAQFGTVSGIQQLETAFGDLSTALQSSRALQASVLVGKEVLVATGEAELNDQLRGAVQLPGAADDLRVFVEGAHGELIHEIKLGAQAGGLVEFDWNGVNAEGDNVAPDVYSVRAEASYGGESQAMPVLSAANVNSVSLDRAGVDLRLDLGALGEVELAAVRRIGAADESV